MKTLAEEKLLMEWLYFECPKWQKDGPVYDWLGNSLELAGKFWFLAIWLCGKAVTCNLFKFMKGYAYVKRNIFHMCLISTPTFTACTFYS